MLQTRGSTCRPMALFQGGRGRGRSGPPPRTPKREGGESKVRLPDSGFFAEADPKAEVRKALGFVENTDFTKRPGRYQSDFIWNSDWQAQLDREAAEEETRKKQLAAPAVPAAGGLGLSRLHDLNSMDVDLSEQLRPRKVAQSPAAAQARQPRASTSSRYVSNVTTQGDFRRWERSGKFSRKAVASTPTATEEAAILAEQLAAERREYETLKQELQLWTLLTTAVCLAAASFFYTRDTAISYGVGAIGSFLYLRMLTRSMDGLGTGGIASALSQPRLLIPIILALGYNRWNKLEAAETGITLELLPMLLGFFTYKFSVVGKQGVTLLSDLAQSAAKRSQALEH